MKARVRAFVQDDSGQTMIEYVMLGLLLSVVAVSVKKK